jgi:chemotaxis receptor (MCP) glutamine deamidase CheD
MDCVYMTFASKSFAVLMGVLYSTLAIIVSIGLGSCIVMMFKDIFKK